MAGTPERLRTRNIPALDGYRAAAALMVLTTHVGFATGAILWPGGGPLIGRMDFGVALFFLLSGFLLAQPWFLAAGGHRGWPQTASYLRRRAARILPAYWIAMAAALLLLAQNAGATVGDWLRYALLVQVYSEPSVYAGLTHMWSLAVEVSFYALLPPLMWLMIRWRRHRPNLPTLTPILLALLVAGLGCRLLALGLLQDTMAGLWLPGYLDWFALGMIAGHARVLTLSDEPPPWVRTLQDVAADGVTCVGIGVLLFVLSTTPVAGPVTLDQATVWEGMVKHVLYGAAAFFMLLPAYLGPRGSRVERVMTVRPLRALGLISYGIFLWHLLLLELLQPLLGLNLFGGGFWLLWPVTVVASIVVATLSWFVVERPLLMRAHATTWVRAVPSIPDAADTREDLPRQRGRNA